MTNETNVTPNSSNELMLSQTKVEMFLKLSNNELKDLTSEIVKMEAGQEINGVILRELAACTDSDGESYDAVSIKKFVNGGTETETILVADTVVISAHHRLFSSIPEDFAPIRLVCKGMRKTADGKREYRDIKVFTI
jgi:hypothetical protein